MKKLIIIAAISFLSISLSAQDGDVLAIGQELPEFTLTSVEHGVLKSSDLKGKVVLVTLFATWCGPCQLEMAAIDNTLYPALKDNKDFRLVVIGREHSDKELKTYNEKKKFTFPIYPDAKKEVTPLFATKYIPRTYLINKEGKVVSTSRGFDSKEFTEKIKEIEMELQK